MTNVSNFILFVRVIISLSRDATGFHKRCLRLEKNMAVYLRNNSVRNLCIHSQTKGVVGWCDGAGLTSSAGASYNFDYSRARAYCACSRCGWGLFGHFYSQLSLLSSFSLSLGDGPI